MRTLLLPPPMRPFILILIWLAATFAIIALSKSDAAVLVGRNGDVWATFESHNSYDGRLTVINTGSVEIALDTSVNLPPWIAGYSLAWSPSYAVAPEAYAVHTIYYWGRPEDLTITWNSGSTTLTSGTMPIPEPSVALLGLAGASLLLIRRGRAM